MPDKSIKSKLSRFDTRLPREQKILFERAARLGGYRSLTDFVVLTAQEKAEQIIKEQEQVLKSKRDSEIFFEAIMNPGKPNKKLKEAVTEYNSFLSK